MKKKSISKIIDDEYLWLLARASAVTMPDHRLTDIVTGLLYTFKEELKQRLKKEKII